MSGWNTIANSGRNAWTRSKLTCRESIKVQREESYMESSTDGRHRVVVRRRLPVPRDVVFEAWTDPEGIREWMCPGDATSAEAVLDVRVGGSFRITMKGKERDHVQVGTYQVVDRPSKLVFTWSEIEKPGEVTLVTV